VKRKVEISPATITGSDHLKHSELSGLGNGIISGWIGQTYYDLSDPEVRKELMKNKPQNDEWIHIIKSKSSHKN